jgi:lipopolysaccharide/colanic/teichoic acid biosynthesis glycosyltransferase
MDMPPRPPIPSEVDKYDLWQRRRLSVKPGMPCLWQTALNRNEVRFEDWMNLDLQYIDNWSLKLDFLILLRTLRVVFSGEGR